MRANVSLTNRQCDHATVRACVAACKVACELERARAPVQAFAQSHARGRGLVRACLIAVADRSSGLTSRVLVLEEQLLHRFGQLLRLELARSRGARRAERRAQQLRHRQQQ
eukprot:6181209-Pleurochrysis_carterae.AAC.4